MGSLGGLWMHGDPMNLIERILANAPPPPPLKRTPQPDTRYVSDTTKTALVVLNVLNTWKGN